MGIPTPKIEHPRTVVSTSIAFTWANPGPGTTSYNLVANSITFVTPTGTSPGPGYSGNINLTLPSGQTAGSTVSVCVVAAPYSGGNVRVLPPSGKVIDGSLSSSTVSYASGVYTWIVDANGNWWKA